MGRQGQDWRATSADALLLRDGNASRSNWYCRRMFGQHTKYASLKKFAFGISFLALCVLAFASFRSPTWFSDSVGNDLETNASYSSSSSSGVDTIVMELKIYCYVAPMALLLVAWSPVVVSASMQHPFASSRPVGLVFLTVLFGLCICGWGVDGLIQFCTAHFSYPVKDYFILSLICVVLCFVVPIVCTNAKYDLEVVGRDEMM